MDGLIHVDFSNRLITKLYPLEVNTNLDTTVSNTETDESTTNS